MLFVFGEFWKTIFTVFAAWLAYVFVGFELSVITLLSLIIASSYRKS